MRLQASLTRFCRIGESIRSKLQTLSATLNEWQTGALLGRQTFWKNRFSE